MMTEAVIGVWEAETPPVGDGTGCQLCFPWLSVLSFLSIQCDTRWVYNPHKLPAVLGNRGTLKFE